MNKFLKGFFLSATLLIPILIFLFLKFFGDNRFDIPVYYQQGVEHSFIGCELPETGQYRIEQLSTGQLPGVYFFLQEQANFKFSDALNIRKRVKETVGDFTQVLYSSDSNIIDSEVIYLSSNELITRMRCSFATDTLNQFVLVDSQKRIRGYYNTEREEIDRLIVELKILLENEGNDE